MDDTEIAALQARVARLEAALAFYAQASNYWQTFGVFAGIPVCAPNGTQAPVITDGGEQARAALASEATNDEDRIDYDDGNLDDVAIANVSMFRLEYMADNNVWIRCYRSGQPDVVFWLQARGKIKGLHEYD